MSKLSFLIHSGFEVNYAEMVRKQTTQTTPEKSARELFNEQHICTYLQTHESRYSNHRLDMQEM